ncbi:TetR/AcrR family transcriptional regulator [Actinomadura alba]|uniref:TetR/AcrR family transcriptional regulator n=1 Tax=Actinomadura alba TaxID=406431 RepID=A0ABR7LVJ6_9ACTN|nr:TetR family transcriptional regulator [Actinomadura alba]MBC6468875.1 TetR/AcrR family transcriptional regulator [Actinomadura alba]
MENDLVAAALSAARERGQDVAEVPLTAIATAAGISRSTLLRRLGGTRAALDEAVRQAGVDPGGRPPVRERAITAAARLIADQGLGAITLDAVADAAQCSLPSLHVVFEGRDGLLAAVFDRFGPVPDLEALAADPPSDVEDTVRAIYRAMVAAFGQEPRVLPAVFADLFGRPGGPASRMMQATLPRMVTSLRALLIAQVAAGRLRPLPFPLLVQLLLGPIAAHMLLRPTLDAALGPELPPVDETCEIFAEAFLRAAAMP